VKRLLAFLSLFGSMATLLCCALPATLVAIGIGGVFAGLMGTFPQLSWVSFHKQAIFVVTGILLVLGGWLQWRARLEPCPVDLAQAAACRTSKKYSVIVYGVSVGLYLIGFFFAFVLQN
jgi:hypothetical protein